MNSLVYVGQLIYKGLVALGTFLVNLGQAIADWGMKALGQIRDAAGRAIQAVANSFNQFLDWVVNFVTTTLKAAVESLLSGARQLLDATVGGIVVDVALTVRAPPGSALKVASGVAARVVALVTVLALIPVAIRVAESIVAAATAGVGWLVTKLISKTVAEFVVKTLALAAVSLAVAAVFAEVFDTVGWIEQTTLDLLSTAGLAVTIIAGVAEVVFITFETLFNKIQNEPSVIKRWKGFAVALLSLILIVAGGFLTSGLPLAAIDSLAAALAIYGFAVYVKESKRAENRALDLLSSMSHTFETIVVYASPPVAGATIGIHLAQGKYNG